ncbi:MAG: FAD:protein FMN transferase [Cryomorphaceae bacterium]|nr:FAD:protein FMN transferase [Cryomorphaceae bacterium]
MLRTFSLLASTAILISSCQNNPKTVQRTDYGRAQGSTYAISYIAPAGTKHQPSIDSILEVIDQSMSTYRDNSTISAINRGENVAVDEHFWRVWQRSVDVWKDSEGLFDVTIYPLVSLWNFERKQQRIPSNDVIDSVRALVGMEMVKGVSIDSFALPTNMKMDFNAIAQGYTVDVIAEFLESKGIDDYLVEVGGELRTKGRNIDGQIWRIGIEKPDEEERQDRFQRIVSLKDAALATSGSYRKYIEDTITGTRYSHAVNPITGFATNDPLMSVTVIAETAMDADAYATALLVMGLNKAKAFMHQRNDMAIYLIYYDKYKGWQEIENAAFQVLDSK